ncbi:unnamed protein product [Rotaria sp. Silwood1]|nr:unnamed protein product [Rotaria sp. Silwood1]CAF3386925.1 unnamed protein product [Rotaria sp. Silwood1]
MLNQNCGTTLVSQLLDSIDGHLKNVHSPMEKQLQEQQAPEYEMSVDSPDDDELWLSGHRSIFSSYGSYCRKTAPPIRDSQYEGFHWDLYEDRNYHHLAFEQDQHDIPPTCQATSLSEWSMRLSSGINGGEGDTEDDADVEGDDTTSSSDPPRTSWHAIKSKSIHRSCSSSANTSDGSEHRSRSPLTLYRLFQRTRSQQHPCRLYQNFSDKSMCDSLTSSSSCSNINKLNESNKKEHKIPMPRFKLLSPTTFSQIKLNKSNSHNDFLSSTEQLSTESKEQFKASNQAVIPRRSVDQCLQTSIHIDNTPSCQPSSTRRYIPRSISRPLNTDNHCLQTNNISVIRSKSVDRSLNNDIKNSNSNNPSQPSTSHRSLPTISSLPDLSFLTYYAKENPAPPQLPPSKSINQTKHYCSRLKSTLSEPSSLTKKATRTVFYCSIKVPSVSFSSSSCVPMRPTTLHPSISTIQRPRTLKEIKRIKSIKTSPTLMGNSPLRALPLSPSVPSNVDNHIKEEEEHATFSLTCSSTSTSANSTSSSGYFSNSSTNHPRHIQTPISSHPLKSCLKRAKTEDLTTTPLTPATTTTTTANVLAVGAAGDIFTLAARTLAARLGDHNIETPRHRRYSAPTVSSHQQNFSIQLQTRQKGCTLSEHDLRAKKSVSFCDDIARRLITPSASPKHRPTPPPTIPLRYDRDYCDLVPRESLTDSPPTEFNLSDDEHEDHNEPHLINFTEHAPSEITKPLPVKYGSDKYLVDAFANTVLHILEIKCGDPQSYYLNNITNRELDRTLRQDLCPLLREVLEDGLRQYGGSLFSKKINLWRLIDFTTPKTGRFNDAKVKAQLGLSSTVDWIEKFNAFIYHLLNLHELAAWLTHFLSHRSIFTAYYESWAFILVHVDNDLFERITNQLEKLSPLPFRLKYTHSSNLNSSTRTTTTTVTTTPTTTTTTTTNQRPSSLLPKRFNVRAWLRDRKTQVKISPKEPSATPPSSSSSSSLMSKSPSSSTIPSSKPASTVSTKSSSTVPSVPPPPNVSLRRKLGSIPVPKRHQTVH